MDFGGLYVLLYLYIRDVTTINYSLNSNQSISAGAEL